MKPAAAGAAIGAISTLVVGLTVVAYADLDKMPRMLELVLTPFYAVLLFPSAIAAWSILGDDTTASGLQTLATIIALPVNTVIFATIGAVVAWYRRRNR